LHNSGRLIKRASLDTLDCNGDWTGRRCPLFPNNGLRQDRLRDRGWSFGASTSRGGDASRPSSTCGSADASFVGSSRAAGAARATFSTSVAAVEEKPLARSYSCSAFETDAIISMIVDSLDLNSASTAYSFSGS
jgi:hypothetical protein